MSIQVKVFGSKSSLDSNQRIFEQIVSNDDSLSFPYQKVVDVMHLFYPGSIVQFNIQ